MEYPQQHQTPPPPSPPQQSFPPIDIDSKILSDLSTVQEKITLCQSMLVPIHHTSQVDINEPLLALIGFLEACVPRVRELIDVGMNANLKEETLTKCFQVNDDLCKILDDVDHPEKVVANSDHSDHSTPSPAVAPAGAMSNANASDDILDSLEFDAFGFEDKKRAVAEDDDIDTHVKAAAVSPKATSALEDLLAPPTSKPPAPTSPASVPATTSDYAQNESSSSSKANDDDFDDFVGKRVTSNNSFSIDE